MPDTIDLASGATEAGINSATAQLAEGGTIVLPANETIDVSSRDIALDLDGSPLVQADNVNVIWAFGRHPFVTDMTLGTGMGATTRRATLLCDTGTGRLWRASTSSNRGPRSSRPGARSVVGRVRSISEGSRILRQRRGAGERDSLTHPGTHAGRPHAGEWLARLLRLGAVLWFAAALAAVLAAAWPGAPTPPPPQAAAARPEPPPAPPTGGEAPPPAPVPTRVLQLSPPYTIIDSRTFASATERVTLTDVEGPEREAVCLDQEHRQWACGLAARAALNNATRERDFTCRTAGAEIDGALPATCEAGGEDLAGRLIAEGWLRPLDGHQFRYRHQSDLAERGRRGLWRGGWTYR